MTYVNLHKSIKLDNQVCMRFKKKTKSNSIEYKKHWPRFIVIIYSTVHRRAEKSKCIRLYTRCLSVSIGNRLRNS